MKVTGSTVVYALVAIVLIGVAGYVVVFVLGGSTDVVASRAALIATAVAPTVGVLIALLNQAHLADVQQQTKQLLNGHLEKHIGHTDDQVKAIVDEKLQGVRAAAAPLEPNPEARTPTGGE